MAADGTTTPSVTIVKTFTYRGAAEEWANTYHFDGGDPANDAEWKAIADAIIAQEKLIHPSTVTIIRAVGHKAGESVHVWAYDYLANAEQVAGTRTSADSAAGDQAAWIRWSTTQFTSKGKPIYLRSYYHAPALTGTPPDTVLASYRTILETFGTFLKDFLGDDSRHRAGPHGAVGQTVASSQYVTTRTLKRRGKRRPPA